MKKKVLFITCLIILYGIILSQTNLWAASGNIEIGTTNPLGKLHIQKRNLPKILNNTLQLSWSEITG